MEQVCANKKSGRSEDDYREFTKDHIKPPVKCVFIELCIVASSFITLFIISQGHRCRLKQPTGVCVSIWAGVFQHGSECGCLCSCLLFVCPSFSHFWNRPVLPEEFETGLTVRLRWTPHLAGSSRPTPLLASLPAGRNRNSLIPSSCLYHSHLSVLRISLLITLLY